MKKSIPFPSALPFSISRGDRDLVIPGTRFSVPRMLHGPNVLTVRNGAQQTHAAGTITAPSLASTSAANFEARNAQRSQRTETKPKCALSVAPSNRHQTTHHINIETVFRKSRKEPKGKEREKLKKPNE